MSAGNRLGLHVHRININFKNERRIRRICISGERREVYIWATGSQKVTEILRPAGSLKEAGDYRRVNGDFHVRGPHSPGWVEFSPGARFVAGGWKGDGIVRVWDRSRKVEVLNFEHAGICMRPVFLREQRTVTVSDSEIKIWNLDDDSPREAASRDFGLERPLPQCIVVTADGKYAFVGCADFGIYVSVRDVTTVKRPE